MNFRKLGKTHFQISEVGLGTWQVGGKWGSEFSHDRAQQILNTAVENGVNFIDTADVYGDGESEKAVGKFVKTCKERIYVATKCGRQLKPHTDQAYTPQALRGFVEASLKNMHLETLDLVQLHCPPTETYQRPEIFGEFELLKKEGKVQNLGVSVQTIAEAISSFQYDNVTTVQLIFNIFRQKPAEEFFQKAKESNIGLIIRVPLASGMLSGKFDENSVFAKEDHRNFNRNGEAFDKGETFSGVNYKVALEAVKQIKEIFEPTTNLAHVALAWILSFEDVSTVIPGASSPQQVISNCAVDKFPVLSVSEIEQINKVYQSLIKEEVHHLW
ncbi:Predicted oxidoreductase [Spirosomataceae bacterium TFI 002]|nr:Predicted oxidoreductase [Spirosomataceae bacterium TFI 002]